MITTVKPSAIARRGFCQIRSLCVTSPVTSSTHTRGTIERMTSDPFVGSGFSKATPKSVLTDTARSEDKSQNDMAPRV